MGKTLPFAELCAKTNFSLLEGASRPEEMVERAHELGLSALAVADSRGLYGSVRAHIAAQKVAQKYIVGTELLVDPSSRGKGTRSQSRGRFKAVFLVENQSGYKNLCRLITRAHADLPREEALLPMSFLEEHHAGLFVILGAPSEREIARGELSISDAHLPVQKVREIFGERVFVATCRMLTPDDAVREAWAKDVAARTGTPLIASARPLFHHPSRKPVADVLQCIRDKTTLERAGDLLAHNAQAYLRSPVEMARLFRDDLARLSRTVEIAKACTFSLSELKYSFPCDDVAPGETAHMALARLVGEWAPRKYPQGVPRTVTIQLEKELALIAKLEVAQFFLSVYEIVKIAREKSILCQGRGSAANSAVCYVLGITAVDPARSSLLFERFLSCERHEPPDIDVDFEHERREEVIQAIYEKYGRERAAMVSEVTCYRGKSALRETAKAMGLSLTEADRLTQMVGPYDPVDANVARLQEIGFDPRDRRLQLVLRIAREIQGFPRHMSTHVGGFVLSARPLDEVSPTEPAKIPGRTVVPWDKDDIDALGFFKVDVLGLGMLTALRKALELIHQKKEEGERGKFDPIAALAQIPPEAPTVYDAICRADTIGVFQIESRAQMAMLPRMRPRKFYDLVIEVAIVRPGPIQGGMVHPYLRRRNEEEPPTMPHPSLAPILDRTLGVPLFQEQVMQIAIVGGGYTAGEADELRRDMAAWKRTGKLLRHHDKLIKGFVQTGISAEFAERLFSQIKGFGEYGFPESHASSFALLVYASSWVKTHHPLEFACALLNSQPMGFYSPSSIVRDAQKHGVCVLAPDVAASSWDSTIERSSQAPATRCLESEAPATRCLESEAPAALRLGLRLVKGMGEESVQRIEKARSLAPFRDTKDLSVRAEVRIDQLDALAEASALSSLSKERRQAMWQVRAPSHGPLFAEKSSKEPEVSLPPILPVEQLRFDYARLGLSVDDHPMRHLRPQLKKRRVISRDQLEQIPHGTQVSVAGLVLSRQRPQTASGVVFITLEDESGMINVIVTPDIFERFHQVAVHARLLLIAGKVERTPRRARSKISERTAASARGQEGRGLAEESNETSDSPGAQREEPTVIHVLAQRLEALQLTGGLESRSRDFR